MWHFLQNNKGDIFSWKNVTCPKVTLFFDNEGDIFSEKNVTLSKGDILAPYHNNACQIRSANFHRIPIQRYYSKVTLDFSISHNQFTR